ncbi:MAG: DUF2807 domain-containing protein [Bacteroidales bacterium]|nr:DUF2807 domain-containing protein [Bacteroidales bacterium]
MALACSCYFEGWNNGITGAGNVVEEKRDLDGFTGLHITSGVDVFLSQDAEYTVRVEADENLVEMIKTEVKGELLEVGVEKPGIRRAESKKVFVSLPDLKSIRVSSAGDCTGETPFRCEELDIEVSSAGDLTMEVYARRIDLDISSSGDVKLSGEAGDFEADLSSAGDLDAFDLTAKRVDVSVSSAGNAKVFATEELRMVSSSAGYIYYRGDAKIIRSSSSSAGNIISQN